MENPIFYIYCIIILIIPKIKKQQNQFFKKLQLLRLLDCQNYCVFHCLISNNTLICRKQHQQHTEQSINAKPICKSQNMEPKSKWDYQKTYMKECALHGLFTEIACMENFRLTPQVATLYDYGVTSSDYIIVMKKYPQSLKEWRQQKKGSFSDNLAVYSSLYKEVLQAVQMLRYHNVTNYDIKADNVLLDGMHVVLTDFGESSIFINEEGEYCVGNRGTEYIKSPEMLTLTMNSKKEQDTYDRRKKVGTNNQVF